MMQSNQDAEKKIALDITNSPVIRRTDNLYKLISFMFFRFCKPLLLAFIGEL